MKNIFLIAAITIGCASSTTICMMMDKYIYKTEEERRMLAEHEMLVAPKKGHPISYRSMLSLPQKQKEEANQHNQDLAAYRIQNAPKQKERQRKEANRIMQICQENKCLISQLTIMYLHPVQQEQAFQHNQTLIAQYKKQK